MKYRRIDDPNYWPVFGDIALAMLLVFFLFVLAQFLHYERIFVLNELGRRQEEVRTVLATGLPANMSSALKVEKLDDYRQRLTFASDLLFASCRTEVHPRGIELITAVASLLRERADYFQSVQIEGHTDPRRPAGPPQCPVEDNWELSSQRATGVLRLMADTTRARFPGELLSAVGRGPFHPIASADSLNRRIEVVLQYTDKGILK